MKPGHSEIDFEERPYIAIWEVTQACDLACLHCRACAQPRRHPLELSTGEGKRLIDQIGEMKVPVFVLTGGDPIKRPDLFELIEYATEIGLRVSLTPSATPLLTREIICRLKACGLARLAVSLDGSNREACGAMRNRLLELSANGLLLQLAFRSRRSVGGIRYNSDRNRWSGHRVASVALYEKARRRA